MNSRQRQVTTRQRPTIQTIGNNRRYNHSISEHICCRSCETKFIKYDARSVICIYGNNGQIDSYRLRAERSINITRGNANILHCGSCHGIIGHVNNHNGFNFRYFIRACTTVKSITIIIN